MCSSGYVCKLSEEVQNYARVVLNETEISRKTAFEELKKWSTENYNLNVCTNENVLLPFLRVSKFDLEKTKRKLTNFYKMRRDIPEWFENRDPTSPKIQQLIKMGSILVLKETFGNKIVVVVRPSIHNPKMYHLDDVIKAGLMILDVAVMEEELAQIYGVIAVIDLKNVGLFLLKQMTPSRIRNLVNAWQNFNCRPQRIEFVNCAQYVSSVLNIFKKFMSQKLKHRVYVCHDGFSSVAEYINKDILPNEYGGIAGTLEELGEYWNQKLITYSEWFAEDEKFKAAYETSKRWF